MNQSESECQDAFSQTLGKTPLTKQNQHQQRPPNHDQQQGYHSHYQRDERKQQRRTSSSLRKGQSINRLSRMFENDVSNGQSSNATHQLIKGAKPKLPTKPPSLRSQQSTSNSGSSAAIQTHLAKSATSKADDSNVDETSLAFRDVRARFQQSGTDGNIKTMRNSLTPGRSFYTNPHDAPQNISDLGVSSRSSAHTPKKPPCPPPTVTKRFDSITLDPSSPSRSPTSSSIHTPTDVSSTAAYSRRRSKLATPSTLPTRDIVSDDSLVLPNPQLLIPKRSSQAFLQQQVSSHSSAPPTGPTSIHTLSRSGTGNSSVVSGASTSSLSSSSSTSPATTTSPSKRTWNGYGNPLSSWFGSNTSNTDAHHQQLKSSIVTVNTESTSSSPILANENAPISATTTTTTATDNTAQELPLYSTSFESSSTQLSSPTSVSTSASTTTSLPTGIPPHSTGTKEEKGTGKRTKVMNEIWTTETSYQNDMLVLKEVYYDPALQPDSGLSLSDVKHVFSNLLAIIDLESDFVDLLSMAIQGRESTTTDTIGMVFRTMMQQIDQVYCDYCKRHTDSVIRLQELESKPKAQQFLQSCAEQLPGRTQSWDLGSLLIKPVQRVLKYPLLLKELLSVTPMDHPDYENLSIANDEIQKVADHINEIKRRKDIVDKIVGDKKKTEINVVHGINKKLTRKAHRIRQVAGLAAEATQDTLFDTLHQKFEDQQEIARQLARDIQAWVRQVKDNFDNLLEFATSLDEVYSAFGGVRVRSMNQIKEFTKMAGIFRLVMSRELDTMIHGYIYTRIEGFLLVFENPSQVISKRGQKLLDYDRVRGIKARGDIPDKALQESADAYVSINAQLVEELPLLFNLTRQYFDIIVGDLAMVQAAFYEQTYREWNKLTHHLRQDSATASGEGDIQRDAIIARYQEEMDDHVRPLINNIMPLNKEQWKMVLGVLPLTPLTDDLMPADSRLKFSDGYFDRTLSAQSFNDDDTRSSISSRKHGSPMWKESNNHNSLMEMGRTPTDDETSSSKATTPQQDDHHSKTQDSSVTGSSYHTNMEEPVFECVVVHDYLEPSLEALSVHKGDTIQVWVEDEDENGLQGAWLYASLSKMNAEHFGWVPSEFCQRL